MSTYKSFETVGELIDILSQIPRDTKILKLNDNMEQHGYRIGSYINTEIEKFSIKRVNTYDAFDGTPYSYDCISRIWGDSKEEEVNLTGILI